MPNSVPKYVLQTVTPYWKPTATRRWPPVEDVHKFRSVIPPVATGETFFWKIRITQISVRQILTVILFWVLCMFLLLYCYLLIFEGYLDSPGSIKDPLFLGFFVAFLGDNSLIFPPKN